jgi:hypothetical protein
LLPGSFKIRRRRDPAAETSAPVVHSSFGHVSSVGEEGRVLDEAAQESVVRLYVEPVKLSPARSDRGLLEPG